MIFHNSKLTGCRVLELAHVEDERGYFTRTFCAEEFTRHGLDHRVAQCSVSYNQQSGTLRGLHYQAPPHAEAKLVRCTRGRIFDVALDLRPGSPTFRQWQGWEIDGSNQLAIYLPEGMAHGFLTLEPASEVTYHISTRYHPESARGIHWADPSLAIAWPTPPTVISDRDDALPLMAADGQWTQ